MVFRPKYRLLFYFLTWTREDFYRPPPSHRTAYSIVLANPGGYGTQRGDCPLQAGWTPDSNPGLQSDRSPPVSQQATSCPVLQPSYSISLACWLSFQNVVTCTNFSLFFSGRYYGPPFVGLRLAKFSHFGPTQGGEFSTLRELFSNF